MLTGVTISKVSYDDGHFTITLGDQEVTVDKLLVAAGRTPNLDDLGLETVGLDPGARSVETDEQMSARRGTVGDRRHRRARRLHAHVDVPVGDRRREHPRQGGSYR